jgi:hypothetical protein
MSPNPQRDAFEMMVMSGVVCIGVFIFLAFVLAFREI